MYDLVLTTEAQRHRGIAHRPSHGETADSADQRRFHRTIADLTQRRDIASGDGAEWQAGSLPLQRAERLCSGKLPACHSFIPGKFVILSERSESKNPPKFGTTPQESRSSYPRGTLPTSLSELVGTARLGRRTPSLRVTAGAQAHPPPHWRSVLCSAGVPPAPHALMQACWIRVLSTSHRRRDAGATKALESFRHAPSKKGSALPRYRQGGAAVLRAQRPWDRAGGTKARFQNDSTIPRWWRSKTVADSAVCLGCDVICVLSALSAVSPLRWCDGSVSVMFSVPPCLCGSTAMPLRVRCLCVSAFFLRS